MKTVSDLGKQHKEVKADMAAVFALSRLEADRKVSVLLWWCCQVALTLNKGS